MWYYWKRNSFERTIMCCVWFMDKVYLEILVSVLSFTIDRIKFPALEFPFPNKQMSHSHSDRPPIKALKIAPHKTPFSSLPIPELLGVFIVAFGRKEKAGRYGGLCWLDWCYLCGRTRWTTHRWNAHSIAASRKPIDVALGRRVWVAQTRRCARRRQMIGWRQNHIHCMRIVWASSLLKIEHNTHTHTDIGHFRVAFRFVCVCVFYRLLVCSTCSSYTIQSMCGCVCVRLCVSEI